MTGHTGRWPGPLSLDSVLRSALGAGHPAADLQFFGCWTAGKSLDNLFFVFQAAEADGDVLRLRFHPGAVVEVRNPRNLSATTTYHDVRWAHRRWEIQEASQVSWWQDRDPSSGEHVPMRVRQYWRRGRRTFASAADQGGEPVSEPVVTKYPATPRSIPLAPALAIAYFIRHDAQDKVPAPEPGG